MDLVRYYLHPSISPTTSHLVLLYSLTPLTTVISTPTASRHDFECLFEIRDDIFDVFYPYGYLFQTFALAPSLGQG
jgi:hypothetical protein